MIGIYMIYNAGLHKVYIGQSEDIERRIEQHFKSLQKNKHSNKMMQEDYNGMSHAFQIIILKECYPSQLNYYEKEFIKYYHSDDPRYGYNLTKGGAKRKRLNKKGRYSDLLDELTG